MTSPLRVGLIGVGWGAVVQVPAFRLVPEYEVTAICSRRPERVVKAGEALGITDTSADWESFVRRDDLDVISVCTPVDLHAEQTIAAIEAGKHVLVEKPQALTADDAKLMLDAAESAGVAHAVCFEGRYEHHRLPVTELVADGFLGQPYVALANNVADYWHPSRGLQSEWMYRLDQGGGYLMGLSSHDIDFLLHLFGEPEALCAEVRSSVPVRTRPDGTDRQSTPTTRRRSCCGCARACSPRSRPRPWVCATTGGSSTCSGARGRSPSPDRSRAAPRRCAPDGRGGGHE